MPMGTEVTAGLNQRRRGGLGGSFAAPRTTTIYILRRSLGEALRQAAGTEMGTLYDIFECLPDGSVNWRVDVSGLIKARRKLRELVETRGSQYFAMQTPTRAVIFHSEGPALGKRVFQIAYTKELGNRRAHLLRTLGYGVLSVIGNNAARKLLAMLQMRLIDVFFMVGHAAPESTRTEIVEWLKAKYPPVGVVALNPPNQELLCADYNVLVPENGAELWPPLLAALATGPSRVA
jgi:hypothetical protein